MEPNAHPPRNTQRVMWEKHPARGDSGRGAKELENNKRHEKRQN